MLFVTLHLLAVAAVRYAMRFAGKCNPVKTTLDEFPDEMASGYRPRIAEVEGLGFVCAGTYDCGNLSNDTRSYVALFVKPGTDDYAQLSAVITPMGCSEYLEFSTTLSSGVTLETNSNAIPPLVPANPDRQVFRFPKTRAAQNLYGIHRQLLAKHANGMCGNPEGPSDPLRRYIRTVENFGPRLERAGWLRPAGDGFQLTWKGALLLTWRGVWPNTMLRRLHQQHQMQEELRGLQVQGVTALQKA